MVDFHGIARSANYFYSIHGRRIFSGSLSRIILLFFSIGIYICLFNHYLYLFPENG